MTNRITIDTALAQARLLLLDQAVGPTVPSPSGDITSSRLVDVRVPGKGPGIGTQGWLAGEAGLPFGVLTAGSTPKSYKTSGRAINDWLSWLHIGLALDVDGFTDLRGWAYAWDDALEQWFPQMYRLGALGLSQDLGDVWWLYESAEVTVFDIANRPIFGLVCRLRIHLEHTINWGVGLSTVPS